MVVLLIIAFPCISERSLIISLAFSRILLQFSMHVLDMCLELL